MKRLNPDTNAPYCLGDYRDDGYRFWGYHNKKDKSGYFYLIWRSEEGFKKAKKMVVELSIKWNKLEKVKAIRSFYTSKRRTIKLNRMPKWLTQKDIDEIKTIYEKAKLLTEFTGEKWEVDHILPLQGKKISGFHTPNNLKIILKTDNAKKNNKFYPC